MFLVLPVQTEGLMACIVGNQVEATGDVCFKVLVWSEQVSKKAAQVLKVGDAL